MCVCVCVCVCIYMSFSSLFKAESIPEAIELHLSDVRFNDFSLESEEMVQASIRIFIELGLLRKFRIDYEVRIQIHFLLDIFFQITLMYWEIIFFDKIKRKKTKEK